MTQKITKPGFSKLDMLLFLAEEVVDMLKTMIFVNNINESIRVTTYLYFMLDESMQKSNNIIVWPFASNLKINIKIIFINNVRLKNTCILICNDAAGMRVDMQNVKCSI